MNKQTYRQTDRQTNRQTDIQTNRQTDSQINRHTQTGRRTDGPTDRQTDGQTDGSENNTSSKTLFLTEVNMEKRKIEVAWNPFMSDKKNGYITFLSMSSNFLKKISYH